jgi:hypothetical protein
MQFSIANQKLVIAVVVMVVGFTEISRAADATAPVPDKSQYSIFNPTPDNLLRDLASDRPTKSYSPVTVDAGHFQIEMDLANYAYGTYQGVTTDSFLTANPVIKLGLTNRIDLEIQPGSYQFLRNFDANTHQTISRAEGYGDVVVKTKINFVGNDGGPFAISISPFVKIPSSAPLISNGKVEGGVQLPMVFNLPYDFVLVETPEYDLLKNALDSGTHAGYRIANALSHPIPGINNLTGFFEFYAQGGRDPLIPPVYTLDLGLGYMLNPACQLDGGINFGLNNAAPRLQFYAGISQRF